MINMERKNKYIQAVMAMEYNFKSIHPLQFIFRKNPTKKSQLKNNSRISKKKESQNAQIF